MEKSRCSFSHCSLLCRRLLLQWTRWPAARYVDGILPLQAILDEFSGSNLQRLQYSDPGRYSIPLLH